MEQTERHVLNLPPDVEDEEDRPGLPPSDTLHTLNACRPPALGKWRNPACELSDTSWANSCRAVSSTQAQCSHN
jgi:hypothetical protein